jgi:hypothetical protein
MSAAGSSGPIAVRWLNRQRICWRGQPVNGRQLLIAAAIVLICTAGCAVRKASNEPAKPSEAPRKASEELAGSVVKDIGSPCYVH